MKMEASVEEDAAEARFKDMVFANNLELYKALFGEQGVSPDDQEDDSFNWVVPSSEEEARQLLAEAQGVF